MTLTQDIYYTTEFKSSYDFNYNFNIPLDINIDVRGTDKIKFKLIDFSMINSMLNVSSYHKNNQFKIRYLNVDYIITIPDGSYTPTSLRDTINSILSSTSKPIAFNYNKSTNKYYLVVSNGIIAGTLFFYPLNCASLFGFSQASYELIYPNEYYSDTFANMLPYSKIILTTNLVFDTNVQYNLLPKYSANSGIGDIICWLPRDIPLFSTINFFNDTGREIELANKNIKSINISIINEYQEYILDAPASFIHFQLITYDNSNWFKKFYLLLNDISYYLLSLYFKKNI
jgi:hypothetical protein